MQKATLGDIGNVLMCKRILKSQTNKKNGIPFYKISTFGNIADCFISIDIYNEYKSKYSYPKFGEILISAAGTVGKAVRYLGEPAYYQDSNIVWLRNDESKILNSFLYYFYQTNPFIKTSGSTIDRLYNDNIKNTVIFYPEQIEVQRKISNTLEYLDKKIQHNIKQIETLESLAKTIYDYWFVQFDFPNEEGKPYKSSGGKMVWNEELKREIPEGWSINLLGKLCDCKLGGTPARNNAKYWNGDINWINSGKVNDLRINECSEKITKEGLKNTSTYLLPRNTVVLAITGATLGQISILNIESCTNQSVVGICETSEMPTEYIYPALIISMKYLLNQQTGAAQPHINKNDIESLMIALPTKSVMGKYKNTVKSIYQLIMTLCYENQKLSEQREFLLPLLMNGQVQIK